MPSFFTFFFAIKAEKFFLITAFSFGLLFLFITPPFQVPDEINHFYRACQVAQGNFISVKQDNRVGGTLPASLEKIVQPFIGIRWNIRGKTDLKTIKATLKTPLQPNEKIFMDFPNTAVYSPVCYVPQALGISLLRLFNAPPLYMFYAGRLFALIFWVLLVFYAIRTIPFYKWLLTFLALLPMSVFINMSLSADVVTNAFSFFCIALILKYAWEDIIIKQKQMFMLCFVFFILASAKLAYTPLMFLALLIPTAHFNSRRDQVLKLALLALVGICVTLLWSGMVGKIYTPYSSYNSLYNTKGALDPEADMHKQISYISSHGTCVFKVFYKSVHAAFNMYFKGYVGTFGWLDTQLPIKFIRVMYLIILLIAVTDHLPAFRVTLIHKVCFAAIFVLGAFLVILSQHLIFNAVGADIAHAIQGRYLIPFGPLFWMIFYNAGFAKKITSKKITSRVAILASIFSLFYCCFVIYARYYKP